MMTMKWKAPERIHITHEQLVMMFASSCVEWVAYALQCDYLEIFERMEAVGLIEKYIIPCYEALHTESRDNITADIIETLNFWEQNRQTV